MPEQQIPIVTHGLGQGFPRVVGHCPACGSRALFLGARGHITCSLVDCPNPAAVDEQLANRKAR